MTPTTNIATLQASTLTATLTSIQHVFANSDTFLQATQKTAQILQDQIPHNSFAITLPQYGNAYFTENDEAWDWPYFNHYANNKKQESANFWVVENKQPLLRENLVEEKKFPDDDNRLQKGILSDLTVPLLIEDHCLGTFIFSSNQTHTFTDTHLQCATYLSQILTPTLKLFIENTKSQTFQTLSESTQISLNLEDITYQTLQYIYTQGYDRVRLYLYDATQRAMVGKLQISKRGYEIVSNVIYPIDTDPYTKSTLQKDGPSIYKNTTPNETSTPAWCEIPLKIHENNQIIIIGKISLRTRFTKRLLSYDAVNLLMPYVHQFAVAIRYIQLHDKLDNQAEQLKKDFLSVSNQAQYLESEVAKQIKNLEQRTHNQAALLNISQAVQEMRSPQDLTRVMKTCLKQLLTLGISAHSVGLHRLLDIKKRALESRQINQAGIIGRIKHRNNPKILFKRWQNRETTYISDLAVYAQETHPGNPQAFIDKLHNQFHYPIQSLIDIPFSLGIFSVHSPQKAAFSKKDIDILKDIARVLSLGITRLQDLENIEIQKNDLITLNTDLESKNSELERFTYTVSHDLKSPLVTIKGFLGLLEKDVQENNQASVKNDIQFIRNATDQMHDLLENLLELSRIGRLTNPSENINLNDLVNHTCNILSGLIKERGVHIEVTPHLPTVFADRARLLEVFQNLIENAIKFMGEQPHPIINIHTRHIDNAPVICIQDNGIGIAPQYQQKIFGLFDRLNHNIPGTGIGLSLVQRIIEHHGGKIWVESEGLNQGSTFCFTLPPQTES